MKTVIKTEKTVNKVVNNRTNNRTNNSSKLLETKFINLVNEAKKETKRRDTELNKVNFKNVVIGSNNVLKEECFKLGFAIKLLLSNEQIIISTQKAKENFSNADYNRLLNIFKVIQYANKNSDLYKLISELDGIKTKSGKFVPFFLLRTVNKNIDTLLNSIK
jgi:hypothetical protein